MQNPSTPGQPDASQVAPVSIVKKRPWSVTLLAFIVLIITIINLIRLVLSIRYWVFLVSRSAVSPLYLAVTGLVWSAVGVVLLWGIWKPKPWVPMLIEAVGLTYALYYWLDMIFLKDHPFGGAPGVVRALQPTNYQFPAVLTAVGLALMVWVLSRANSKSYFSEPLMPG